MRININESGISFNRDSGNNAVLDESILKEIEERLKNINNKVEYSDKIPTDEDIVIWINPEEDPAQEYLIRINDETIASNTVWSSEKVNNVINEIFIQSDSHIHLNKDVLDKITASDIDKWNNKSDFNGSYRSLTDKPHIPSIEGLASEEYVDKAIENLQLPSNLATIEDIPTKVSELTNDSNFISEIPNEYITEEELNSKGYLTEHQDISNLATKEELFSKDYNDLTNKPNIPSIEGLASETYVDNAIENIPKIDLSEYATKEELHKHENKDILDRITEEKMNSWNNKSNFDGNYNNLTNKPNIPSFVSELENDSGFISEIPSEYITETELKETINDIEKTVSSDIQPTEKNVTLWVNTSEDESEIITVARINDETVASNTTWSSEKINASIVKDTVDIIDLTGYALKTELHEHSNKAILDSIIGEGIIDNPNYINVTDYGVVEGLNADAKTNTTAFQSILDTYGDTKVILFPKGDFVLNPNINLGEQRNITIEGFSSSFASFSQKNIYTGKIKDTFTRIICAKNTNATFFTHKNCVLTMRNIGFYNATINDGSFDLNTEAKTNVFMQHTVTEGVGNNVEKGKVFITDCAFFGWKVVFGNGFTMQHLEDEWGTGKSESNYSFFKQSCVIANRCRFTRNGVGINQSVDARLIDCSFNKNDYAIVFRKDSGFSSVIGCRIEWNNYNGIYLKEAHDVTISNCEFDCNGYAGLYAYSNTNSNFINNMFRRNGANIPNETNESHKLDYINNVHIYAYGNINCNFTGNNTLEKTISDVGSALTRPSNCVGFDSNENCIISMNNLQGCTKGNKLDGSLIQNNIGCVIANNIPNITQE